MFVDLVGSTERQTRLGDDASDEFRRRYFAMLRAVVERHGGEEVKGTGDGLMVVFRHSVVDAVRCGIELHRDAAELDPDDPAELYVGISLGEAADDDGDWFGTPVNEAARLCAAARPGQTLVSDVVRSVVGSRGGLAFRSIGALELKGLPGPVAASLAETDDAVAAPRVAASAAPSPASRHRRWIGAGALVTVVALVIGIMAVGGDDAGTAAGTAPPLPAYPISYRSRPCPAETRTRVAGARCGVLTVPANRARPVGPKNVVHLGVVRAPPRGQARGVPVLDFGADDISTSPARDTAEEIQLGGRGWPGSGTDPVLRCPEVEAVAPGTLTLPSQDPGARLTLLGAVRSCHDRIVRAGIDLDHFDYVTLGRDMADLIRALRLPRAHLVAGYVATIGAFEVVRELPDVVQSVTLQIPVAPGKSAFTNPIRSLADAFDRYLALCRADPGCAASYPDLRGDLRRRVAEYDAAPALVSGDNGDGTVHDVLLDGDRVARALGYALSHRDTFGLIATAVATPRGTAAIERAIAGQAISASGWYFDAAGFGAMLTGICSYDRYTVDAGGSAILRDARPELAGVDDGTLVDACSEWSVAKAPPRAFEPPAGDVPVLVVVPEIQSGGDNGWADAFRRGLPNATVLTFGTLDSNLLGTSDPPCLAELRRRFLRDPGRPLRGTTACERQTPPVDFTTRSG